MRNTKEPTMRVVSGNEAPSDKTGNPEPAASPKKGVSLTKAFLFVGIAAGIGYYLGKRAGASEAEGKLAAFLVAQEEQRALEAEEEIDLDEVA